MTIRLRPSAAAALNSTRVRERDRSAGTCRLRARGKAALTCHSRWPRAKYAMITDGSQAWPSGADLASAPGQLSPPRFVPHGGQIGFLAVSHGGHRGSPTRPPRALAAEPGDNPLYHPVVPVPLAAIWSFDQFSGSVGRHRNGPGPLPECDSSNRMRVNRLTGRRVLQTGRHLPRGLGTDWRLPYRHGGSPPSCPGR